MKYNRRGNQIMTTTWGATRGPLVWSGMIRTIWGSLWSTECHIGVTQMGQGRVIMWDLALEQIMTMISTPWTLFDCAKFRHVRLGPQRLALSCCIVSALFSILMQPKSRLMGYVRALHFPFTL